ncbi:MAG: glutaredoxin 3 [Sphingomonadales bacterium]|nr:glutaredoxin 3 [Sphingomonadales bacterium]
MANIEIYTKFLCPYCTRAKALLEVKGVAFREIDVTMDAALRRTMMDRSNGRTTVPQIFIDGQHIGGSDELAALDARGGLDAPCWGSNQPDAHCLGPDAERH